MSDEEYYNEEGDESLEDYEEPGNIDEEEDANQEDQDEEEDDEHDEEEDEQEVEPEVEEQEAENDHPIGLQLIDNREDQQNSSSQINSTSILGDIGSGMLAAGAGAFSSGQPLNISSLIEGVMQPVVGDLISEAAHSFFGIDPSTGLIIGAIAGNLIFNLGGKNNSLGSIGKIILDNIISGKFKKKVDPFVPGGRRQLGPPINFYAERDRCLRERCLFEDPQFPADVSSLYYSRSPKKEINWKRPGEIVNEPQLLVEGHSRFDVVQGELGDCWFLAAIANITMRDEMFYRVVLPDQSFTENYAGIFHFQFWQYGKWVDVVIDDRLPTHNGQLIYMHSREHNEFWSALLEKAYAKLYGSYEALQGGLTSEALEDMTGGLAEIMELKEEQPELLLHTIMRGFEMGSMFGCSIDADPDSYEAKMSNGLVRGHAYSITGIRMVNGRKGQTTLLRIRNPWGEQEWNGPWSDESPEWQYVPENIKRDMDVVDAQDGEFWMAFDDFLANFQDIEICHLGPDVVEEIFQMTEVRAPHKPWDMVVFEGAWIKGSTAGGCRNYQETFSMNPQYPLNLKADGTSTMIVALMQKYRRELRNEGLDNLAIGFTIYQQVSSTKVDFENEEPINTKSNFINLREVTGRFETIAGDYIILPSTFKPNEEAEFMLRIFSNGSISSYNETNINQPFSQLNLSNNAFSNNSMTPQYSGPHYEQQQPSAPYQPYYQSQPNPSANPYRPNTNVPYNYGYGGSNFQNILRQPYSIPPTGYNPNTAYAQQQNTYRPYVPNTGTNNSNNVYEMPYEGQNFYSPNNSKDSFYGWKPP